jgi:hypothetical protein
VKKLIGVALACGLFGVTLVATAYPSLSKSPKPSKSAWNAPVLVNSDQAHRETSLALSPTDPKLRIACAPSGVPNTTNNQSYFHITRDGGHTWEPMRVEGGATDARNYTFEGGDCDVAFDAGGTMYTADTWLGSLSVGHSTDGGKTWDGSAVAASSPIVDRPWLVGGPKGTINVTYEDLQCCMPAAIWYTRSTDFGKTFSPAVSVATAGPDGAFTWEGNYVVTKDGDNLYLVYSRRQGAALGDLDSLGPETLWVAVSHDAGQSWKSNLVASMPNPLSYLYPSIAMDKNDNLHVVFSSKTDKDRPIWYTYSDDKGETWTKPLALTYGDAAFSPWVAVDDRSGDVAVVWYGSPDPKANDTGKFEWYFYWARIAGAGSAKPKITSGTTTNEPMFVGRSDMPEFENVRIDPKGRMHIGMSAFYVGPDKRTGWAIYYQTER